MSDVLGCPLQTVGINAPASAGPPSPPCSAVSSTTPRDATRRRPRARRQGTPCWVSDRSAPPTEPHSPGTRRRLGGRRDGLYDTQYEATAPPARLAKTTGKTASTASGRYNPCTTPSRRRPGRRTDSPPPADARCARPTCTSTSPLRPPHPDHPRIRPPATHTYTTTPSSAVKDSLIPNSPNTRAAPHPTAPPATAAGPRSSSTWYSPNRNSHPILIARRSSVRARLPEQSPDVLGQPAIGRARVSRDQIAAMPSPATWPRSGIGADLTLLAGGLAGQLIRHRVRDYGQSGHDLFRQQRIKVGKVMRMTTAGQPLC